MKHRTFLFYETRFCFHEKIAGKMRNEATLDAYSLCLHIIWQSLPGPREQETGNRKPSPSRSSAPSCPARLNCWWRAGGALPPSDPSPCLRRHALPRPPRQSCRSDPSPESSEERCYSNSNLNLPLLSMPLLKLSRNAIIFAIIPLSGLSQNFGNWEGS